MDIGREIRRLREEKGWSQAKLAGAADMGTSGISQIETGTRNPSAVTLSKIAEALGVEVADLFPKAQAPLPLEEQRPNIVTGAANLQAAGRLQARGTVKDLLEQLWNHEITPEEAVPKLERLRGVAAAATRRTPESMTVTRAGMAHPLDEILDDLEHGRVGEAKSKLRELSPA